MIAGGGVVHEQLDVQLVFDRKAGDLRGRAFGGEIDGDRLDADVESLGELVAEIFECALGTRDEYEVPRPSSQRSCKALTDTP